MRAPRIGFLAAFALSAWLLGSGASTYAPGIGYLDGVITAQDEAVYSHAAIRMAETGEWSTPTFMGRFFLYKPPLLYWLAGLSAKWFGVSAWSLRLPSILAAALTAAMVFAWVMSAANWWRALLAVIFLTACPLYLELGRRNMTDAIIMATIVAAAWILARGARPLEPLAACIAIGILCKSIAGLIPILIAGAWWLAVAGRPPLRRLILICGLGLVLAAPWFVFQWETHRRWFEAEFIGVELLAYGASAPPQTSSEPALYFYAARLFGNNQTLCLLALLAIPGIFAAVRLRRSGEVISPLAAIAVMTASILAYQYHNATYLLPLLPLLCIAGAIYAPAWALVGAGVAMPFINDAVPWTAKIIAPKPAAVRLAQEYCEMKRGNDLIVVGIDDNFSISTLPLAKLRYAIQGAVRGEGQVTLDFHRLGIILSVAEFNDFAGARSRHSPILREWGLPGDEALGNVIGWERGDELARLVRANPDRDFLFQGRGLPATAETHRTVGGRDGFLLLSHHALPRAIPARRACRL